MILPPITTDRLIIRPLGLQIYSQEGILRQKYHFNVKITELKN